MAKKERKKETGSGDFENKEGEIILIQLLKCFDLILKDLSSKIKRSRKLKHNNRRN